MLSLYGPKPFVGVALLLLFGSVAVLLMESFAAGMIVSVVLDAETEGAFAAATDGVSATVLPMCRAATKVGVGRPSNSWMAAAASEVTWQVTPLKVAVFTGAPQVIPAPDGTGVT